MKFQSIINCFLIINWLNTLSCSFHVGNNGYEYYSYVISQPLKQRQQQQQKSKTKKYNDRLSF